MPTVELFTGDAAFEQEKAIYIIIWQTSIDMVYRQNTRRAWRTHFATLYWHARLPEKKETNGFRMEASMVRYYEKKHRQGHGDRLRILCKYIYSCKISAITTLYPFSNTISYIIVFHNLFFLYLAYCNISLLQVERCIDPFFLFNFQNV